MEKLKKLLDFLSPFPVWLRIVIVVLIAALMSICTILSVSSCGTTRAVVHNGATGTATEIKITTNNPTSVTATPNVQFKHQ